MWGDEPRFQGLIIAISTRMRCIVQALLLKKTTAQGVCTVLSRGLAGQRCGAVRCFDGVCACVGCTARVDKGLKNELERILSRLIRVRCSVTADTVVH